MSFITSHTNLTTRSSVSREMFNAEMIIMKKCEKHTGKISLDSFGCLFRADFLEKIESLDCSVLVVGVEDFDQQL